MNMRLVIGLYSVLFAGCAEAEELSPNAFSRFDGGPFTVTSGTTGPTTSTGSATSTGSGSSSTTTTTGSSTSSGSGGAGGSGTMDASSAGTSPVVDNADTYVEFSLSSAGHSNLAPNESADFSWQMQGPNPAQNKYTQTNDYSWDATKTSLQPWDHVVLLRNGTVVWGTPPG